LTCFGERGGQSGGDGKEHAEGQTWKATTPGVENANGKPAPFTNKDVS
jgi:hypothetical protein